MSIAAAAPVAFRASLKGMALFATDGWIGAGHYYVWQIALFVSLKQSFAAFGGAMALSALIVAALVWAGAPLSWGMMVALAGVAATAVQLGRHYRLATVS